MTPPKPHTTDEQVELLTIDELAARTGVPSRTIRFYQSSGALQKPGRSGRIALYGPEHVERLGLIGQLQDRGLRMRAIRDLVKRIDAGEVSLDEWLGLEGELQSSWSDDDPRVLERAQLEDMLDGRRPGLLADVTRLDLVEAQPGGTFVVPSPGLLKLALQLEQVGVPLEVSVGATARLRKHLAKAASDLSVHVVDELGRSADEVPQMAEALRQLRPVAQQWVQLIFAREMQQVLRDRLESGAATPKRRRPKKR